MMLNNTKSGKKKKLRRKNVPNKPKKIKRAKKKRGKKKTRDARGKNKVLYDHSFAELQGASHRNYRKSERAEAPEAYHGGGKSPGLGIRKDEKRKRISTRTDVPRTFFSKVGSVIKSPLRATP